jgi:cellulose biosynthesis protein BcsQ
MPNTDIVSVLVLTGPVGVGKTTIGYAVADLLRQAGQAHALIDLDWLRECFPRPANDPFHTKLGLQNLTAISANYRKAGVQRLILVDVVESREMITAYQVAIPNAEITVVRLRAPLPTILERLAQREVGEGLKWHQQRAAVLITQMERDSVEDVLVDTESRAVVDIALEVMRHMHWLN